MPAGGAGLSRLASALHARGLLRRAELGVAADPLCAPRDAAAAAGAGAMLELAARRTIALGVVTYRAPESLRHSLESWRRSGLLDLVDERMVFANDPSAVDVALAKEFGLDFYATGEFGGNVMIGGAVTYLVGNATADYLLLLEKDFPFAPEVEGNAHNSMREIFAGVQLLSRGVADIYRLRGALDFPSEGYRDCCHNECPGYSRWASKGRWVDHQNYLSIYCEPNVVNISRGRAAQCAAEPSAPDVFCYSSSDSAYSNNPTLISRAWYTKTLRDWTLSRLDKLQFNNHDFEESVTESWLGWSPPARICASKRGLFRHYEVDL